MVKCWQPGCRKEGVKIITEGPGTAMACLEHYEQVTRWVCAIYREYMRYKHPKVCS